MPEQKKYLIEIADMPEGSGIWDAAKWERHKDAFMKKYPTANVFEVGQYDANDTDENDQFMLTFENDPESSGIWDASKWERHKDAFTAKYPDAQVNRVRYVDYWGDAAKQNRARREELNQPDPERDARLAEIGYFDDLSGEQKQFDVNTPATMGLKPVSSAIKQNSVSGETEYLDPKVAEFYANDTAYTERLAERARLDAEYESNPSVIAERKWLAEMEKEKAAYVSKMREETQAAMEKNVDKSAWARGYARKHNPGVATSFATSGDYSKEALAGSLANEKAENYKSAMAYWDKADRVRKEHTTFVQGAKNVAKNWWEEYQSQDDIETFAEVASILKRLEKEHGNLNEISDEAIEKSLTEDEKYLVRSFFEYSSAMAEAGADMTSWYKGGQIAAEAVPFMLEILATGGLYKAAGDAAVGAARKGLAKWIRKSAKGSVARAAKAKTTKVLTSKAGQGIISALAGTAARTAVAPGTYTRMAEATTHIDNEGHLNIVKNMGVAAVDAYIENLSEESGIIFKKLFGIAGKSVKELGKALGGNTFARMGQTLGKNSVMQAIAKGYNTFMPKLEALGFHGLPEEIGEEILGNALREATFVQPGALQEMFVDGNFGTMLIGFAPMTILGAAGSAANIGYVNMEAARMGKQLRERMSGHYRDEQINLLMSGIQSAENAQQVQEAISPIIAAIERRKDSGEISVQQALADVKAVYDYGMLVAKNKAMLFAQGEQNRELADAQRAKLFDTYGKFWREDAKGNQLVQTARLNDGRSVFVLSEPAEDGKITIIDMKDGKKGFANTSDIAQVEVEGKEEKQSETATRSLDRYIDGVIASQTQSAEAVRMGNERNAQIDALRSRITEGTKINLGTEGSPVIVIARGTTKEGVRVVDSTGSEFLLGWEQAADALGAPIKVKTDKQIVDEEIAAIAQRNAERKRRSQVSSRNAVQTSEQVVSDAEQTVQEDSRHIPMNEDGTVNESAFWEQSPEEYAAWNDEQNQDGGVDTLEQITIAKNELAGLITQAQQAILTSNPATRKAAKREVQRLQERLARIEALEQKYLDRAVAPYRQRAQMWMKQTGTQVHIIETAEELAQVSLGAAQQSNTGTNVTGFAKDGKAYIYLPGITSEAEVDTVFIHEAVAHLGLKGLLGQQQFDELCAQVWNMMSAESRRVFLQYPGVNGSPLAAADEYIAHIAENVVAGITEDAELTIWEKIVELVRNFLRAMGISLAMNEKELFDLLSMSYADLAKNLQSAEQMAEQKKQSEEQRDEMPTEAQKRYAELSQDLTPEEIKEVAQNDYNAALDAYNAHVANAPKVEVGESSKSFIERKKAYNEKLAELQANLALEKALMYEIDRLETPEVIEADIQESAEEVVDKAATDGDSNRQAEGNLLFRADSKSLVGMHNISEDKLRKAIKQGGLANPSTAVVNIAEYALENYGEISLLMPSSLVDSATGGNVGTYTGDAWTPTYPPIQRQLSDKGWDALRDKIRAATAEHGELYSDIVNYMRNYLEDNRRSRMEYVFLQEKGITPEIQYKGADGYVGIANLEAILGVGNITEGLESYERYKQARPMDKRAFNMWLDSNGDKSAHRELREQIKKEPKIADVLKLNEDVSFAEFDSFVYGIKRKQEEAGKVDTDNTLLAASQYVDGNDLRAEFEQWLESFMESLGAKEVFFAGYTRGGDRIYKENTLENVSRHMRMQGRANAYNDHGLSATKSALLERLTSLAQIRRNKARLQDESAYNKEYDLLKERLFNIISTLADMQEISSNQFMNIDYAESRLQEAIVKKNPVAYLNSEYGYEIEVDGEFAQELKAFINDVKKMPAKYFETKFERPVYLNEFAAAVMPVATDNDIKKAVIDAGLAVFEYDPSVEGSRKEATMLAADTEGIRFRIIGEKGAANLDAAEEATVRLDNLAVAREMENAGKDAKTIKLATGWERGADKLWRYEVPDEFELASLEKRLQEDLDNGISKAWGIVYPSDLGQLTSEYPDFNVDIMVWVGEEFENTGAYSPATEGDDYNFGSSASIEVKAKTVSDIIPVLVHEIQHVIQEKEGFAEGGQARGLTDKLSAELDKRVATIKQLREDGRNEEADELMQMSKGLAEAVINNEEDAYGNYKKLAGEVESRNAAERLGMTMQQRRESLLSETEDVARKDQIILMEGLGMAEGANAIAGEVDPSLRFRVRGENETAEEFYQSVLDDYKVKYNTLADMVLYPINQDTADGFGLTLEELEETGAYYEIEDGEFAIFVHEDADDSLVIENAIFHESIHFVEEFYDYMRNLGKWLWENAESVDRFKEWKEYVSSKYSEDEYYKEMLAYCVADALTHGQVTEFEKVIPGEYHEIVRQLENEIGYDRRTEESRREAERILQQSSRSNNLGEQKGVQKDKESEGGLRFRATEITPEVRDEMDTIAATAIVNGNYMKAPNGADTNLTAEQWAMVRTKGFREWFKDSKVVDENGEPRVVFHGTEEDFTAFDEEMIGENTDTGFYGRGFYFATTREEAQGYGENVMDVFLSLKNPLDLNRVYAESNKWDGATADGAVRWWYGLASIFPEDAISETVYANIDGDEWTIADLKNRIDELAVTSETPFADATAEFGIDEGFFDMMGEEDVNLPEELTDALKANGYDGVINAGAENNEMVALYPSQIKSATDNTGEFSEEEGDIRFRVADSESKREIINNTEPVDVTKGTIVATDGESVSKAALRWFEENVGKELTYNTEVGTVTINRRSVKNSLAHGYSQTKLDAITSLPEGFGRAVYLASEDDFDGKPEVNHYFVYPINYDGSIHYVLCRVKSDVNKSSLYIHEVFPIDAIKGHTLQTAADQSQPHRGISLYLDLLKEVLYGKDTDNLETTNDSAKNIAYAVNENPTEAQKEAGNYKMGHLNLDGYRITIENPKGSIRRGTDSKGNSWENTLNNDYGYIRGTEGVDGDHIDVYLSDNPSEGNVFVIDQVNPQTREFDEHKVMYGFNSAEEAREAYLANFSEGWNGLGTITEVSKDEFKKWIQSSHRKTKPFSEYKSVNAISSQSEGGKDTRLSYVPAPGEIELAATKGIATLTYFNVGFDEMRRIFEESISSEEQNIARINEKPTKTAYDMERLRRAERELMASQMRLNWWNSVNDRLINTSLVEADVKSALQDTEPRNIAEYLSQFFTMRVDRVNRTGLGKDGKPTVRKVNKKVGVMLTPETLEKELGWGSKDWSGIGYIVSAKDGRSLDAIAEMVSEDADAQPFIAGMDTMDIKNEIISFIQSVGSYTEIRDYIKNERTREAQDLAGYVNGKIQKRINNIEESTGMSIDEYNARIISEAIAEVEDSLVSLETSEIFGNFEQLTNDDYEGYIEAISRGEDGGAYEGAEDLSETGDTGGRVDSENEGEPGAGDSDSGRDDSGSVGDRPGEAGGDGVPPIGHKAKGVVPASEPLDTEGMSVDEIVREGKMKAAAENADAAESFTERINRINNALAQLRSALAAQRSYDKDTVRIITNLANDLLQGGRLSDMTRGEIKRLLSVIKDAVGKEDLSVSVDRLMDIMIANQLRFGKSRFEEFLKIKATKVNASGVEARGKLDVAGQQMMQYLKEGISSSMTDEMLSERIATEENNLDSESEVIRGNAENKLVGYYLARLYRENIKASEAEEKDLREEIKDAKVQYDAGMMDKVAYKEFIDSCYEAIRENRMQRVNAFESLNAAIAEKIAGSIIAGKMLADAEKARIERIHHFANSDMEGMPSVQQGKVKSGFWNNTVLRFLFKPLATFDQMLRSFAPKSRSGEGYLWNHFMGGWLKASENEFKGIQKAHEMLDEKVRSVFKEAKRWSDLFAIEKRMPTMDVKFWDGEKMADFKLTQGNLLYIYMVSKMTDGKMKLSKMGITDTDVRNMVAEMDPRFIELADWIQESFLPALREKYNAVHVRLFGAPMAAIDNYFPIRVLANARTREVDLAVEESSSKPSTITGSIIKRTKNSLALDILGSDAFDVVLEHIEQMEKWAAFAEFNKDLNTLLSYNKFRNRVQNTKGIYGSGTVAWNNFRAVAEIAAGVYKPAVKSDSLDKLITNIAKGVTGAKISFRVYTALKQFLSAPAFVSDASASALIRSLANPYKAWTWAMNELPLFEKRWKSRQAGDSRLMETEADWELWKNKIVELAGRYGMTPNAFVDALTVSIGARAIYETKLKEYLDYGYSPERAEEKAKRDATVLFNESQQSNESAFLSAAQVDRTVASILITVFRNSSMGYQRMYVDGIRNIGHMLKKGYREQSIEFMKKQMVRDGLEEDKAARAAERIYNRSLAKNAARVATFGFLVQFAWNLGPYIAFLLMGDDDEEKKDMITDAAVRGVVGGPVEGLAAGQVIGTILGDIATGEDISEPTLELPATSDLENAFNQLKSDPVRAVNDMFNLLVQSGIGVNPQTITDAIVAIVDACNGDMETSKEVAFALMRILQTPQSQIDKLYKEEIGFAEDEGLDLRIHEFAERYAKYKVTRNAPLAKWLYSDEREKELEDRFIKRFLNDAEDLKRSQGSEEAKTFYEYYDVEYKKIPQTLRDLRKQAKENPHRSESLSKEANRILETDEFKLYEEVLPHIKMYEHHKKQMKEAPDGFTRAEEEIKMREEMEAVVEILRGREQK